MAQLTGNNGYILPGFNPFYQTFTSDCIYDGHLKFFLMMEIIMEIHKIVLASISFDNLSKESFLSFTLNKSFSKTDWKMSNKKSQHPCFVEPASQPGYHSV